MGRKWAAIVRHKQQKGFSGVLVVIVLATLIVLILLDFQVWRQGQQEDTKPSQETMQSNRQESKSAPEISEGSDPYTGWQVYSNAAYGLSFKYPSDWRVDESASSPTNTPEYVTKQEYSITLRRSIVKYNQTLSIEILGQPLKEVVGAYDAQFAQAPANKVTKTARQLKKLESVQYSVAASNIDTKLYLFGMGDKTYLFSSINGESNLYYDADYWSKFDKVFDSLQIAQ